MLPIWPFTHIAHLKKFTHVTHLTINSCCPFFIVVDNLLMFYLPPWQFTHIANPTIKTCYRLEHYSCYPTDSYTFRLSENCDHSANLQMVPTWQLIYTFTHLQCIYVIHLSQCMLSTDQLPVYVPHKSLFSCHSMCMCNFLTVFMLLSVHFHMYIHKSRHTVQLYIKLHCSLYISFQLHCLCLFTAHFACAT